MLDRYCWKIVILLMSIYFLGTNCYAQNYIGKYARLSAVPQETWDVLAKKRIFFGHQSVGATIVGGLQATLRDYPNIKINIVNGSGADIFTSPCFAHRKIGKNRRPETKITEFDRVIRENSNIDIAFMKFCYVDITSETNVKDIFNAYSQMIEKLNTSRPQLDIFKFTIPLCVEKRTWKTKLKLLIGKEPWELADNAKRNEYNDLVRSVYGKDGTLFDLARIEATKSDGTLQTFEYKGEIYESLYPGYSDDGAHPNKKGARIIAEQLLLFLANNIKK